MKKASIIFTTLAALTPFITFAQGQNVTVYGPGYDVLAWIRTVGEMANLLIPILLALAVVAFFWGLVKFLFGSKGAGAKGLKAGKNMMISGIVAIFIMATLWGILNFAARNLGINQTNNQLVAPRVVQ